MTVPTTETQHTGDVETRGQTPRQKVLQQDNHYLSRTDYCCSAVACESGALRSTAVHTSTLVSVSWINQVCGFFFGFWFDAACKMYQTFDTYLLLHEVMYIIMNLCALLSRWCLHSWMKELFRVSRGAGARMCVCARARVCACDNMCFSPPSEGSRLPVQVCIAGSDSFPCGMRTRWLGRHMSKTPWLLPCSSMVVVSCFARLMFSGACRLGRIGSRKRRRYCGEAEGEWNDGMAWSVKCATLTYSFLFRSNDNFIAVGFLVHWFLDLGSKIFVYFIYCCRLVVNTKYRYYSCSLWIACVLVRTINNKQSVAWYTKVASFHLGSSSVLARTINNQSQSVNWLFVQTKKQLTQRTHGSAQHLHLPPKESTASSPSSADYISLNIETANKCGTRQIMLSMADNAPPAYRERSIMGTAAPR